MLTPEQLTTLKAAILAETNATFVAARTGGNTEAMASWYNAESNTNAWMSSVDDRILFEACDITKFDNLQPGKQASQTRMENMAGRFGLDFKRQKMRKAVQDIWGNADSVAILEALRRKATKGEVVFGGNSATTNTVEALKLNWEGQLSYTDIINALAA